MGFFDQMRDFMESLRRLASHWRVLAALAVLVAFGAIYIERKLFPPAPPPVVGDAKAPGRTAPGESAPGEAAPGEKSEPQTGETAPDLSSQALDVAARPVVVMKGQSGWDDAAKILAEAIDKVSAAAVKAGLSPNGRPLAVFTETDDKGFKFEAMVPLDKAPEGKPKIGDGLEIGSSPAGRALKFQHRGAYEEIEATYEAITAYLDEKNIDAKNIFVEEYLTDLKKADDEKTEVDIYVFMK